MSAPRTGAHRGPPHSGSPAPSCKMEGARRQTLLSKGPWRPFFLFGFCSVGRLGGVPAMGAKNAAARRPPAQSALQVEKLRLPPSRPGPRSPRCFTTPASRPGGFLWATLPHRGSAPQGSVRARWGQGGTRQRRKLDSVKRQGGATGAGATPWGPGRAGRRPGGARERGAQQASSAGCPGARGRLRQAAEQREGDGVYRSAGRSASASARAQAAGSPS